MQIGAETVLDYVLLLCRIGGCLMLMPGFSSPRVPPQIRVFIAIAATLALAPLLLPTAAAAVAHAGEATVMQLILTETTIGAMIGVMGQFFYLALEFMATALASSLGFSTLPGTPIEHTDPVPPLSSLVTLTATVLFFITDQHWEVVRGLVASYTVMPMNQPFATDVSLAQIGNAMSTAFQLSLQISSPFIVYAVTINFLFGLANKLTPQIAVYFISTPVVIFGGLLIFYFVITDYMKLFMAGFMNWLLNG
jgi:flagellar biosynthesis protein FliR